MRQGVVKEMVVVFSLACHTIIEKNEPASIITQFDLVKSHSHIWHGKFSFDKCAANRAASNGQRRWHELRFNFCLST